MSDRRTYVTRANRTARVANPRDGDQNRKLFYAKMLHAAAVYNATGGGPSVCPSGQKCPFYWTKPGLRTRGRLSPQKVRHSLRRDPKMLNPTVLQTSNHILSKIKCSEPLARKLKVTVTYTCLSHVRKNEFNMRVKW